MFKLFTRIGLSTKFRNQVVNAQFLVGKPEKPLIEAKCVKHSVAPLIKVVYKVGVS